MTASAQKWKVPNTTELASLPPDQISPLAFALSRPWLRAWQDVTGAPSTISLRKIADLWKIPYDHFRKMHNGYYRPDHRPELADLRLLAEALAPVGIPYTVILLASAGFFMEHPSTEEMLRHQADRAFIEKAVMWLYSDAWQASGIYRQQVIALLEEEQTAHLSPLALVRAVAFIVACWRALSACGDMPQSLEDLERFL